MSMMGSPKGIPHYPCPMCGTPVYSSALTCPSCGTDLTRAGVVFSSSSGDSITPVDRKKRRRPGAWLGFVATLALAAGAAGTVGRPWVEPFVAPGVMVAQAASRSASQWVTDSIRGLRTVAGLSPRSARKPRTEKTRTTAPRPATVSRPALPPTAVKPASAVAPSAMPASAVVPPPPAVLIISSTPRGARVQIDGVARGVTPLTVNQLRAGTHRVKITHAGYRPVVRTITVQPGKRIAMGVRLPAQPAAPAARPAAPAPSRPTAAPLELGRVAPQFAAKDRVGIIYRTTDFRGQKLLLVFVQTLDANAQRIIRELNALRTGGTRGAVVVLRPDRVAVRQFVQTEQIQIPVLFGTQELARAYGVGAQPAVLYLVSEDGRVAARQVGRVNPGAVLN